MIRHKTKQGLMTMVLSVIIFACMMSVSALAETNILPISKSGEIIAFEALEEDISVQSVPFGTSETDLRLPDTLTATVQLSVVSGSAIGIVEEDGNLFEAGPMEKNVESTNDSTVSLSVTWSSSPVYNSEAEGTYVFSPKLPEGFTLADGVELPIITVSIAPANDSLLESTVLVTFINRSGREETVYAKRLTEDTGLWDGWYYVTGYVHLKYSCAVNGDAKIILTDGSYLSAPYGINVWEGDHQIPRRSLTIYGQKEGTGTLYARNYRGAAIGAERGQGAGDITIVGGQVTAYGENGGAGIGGSQGGKGATFTMYGGAVTAMGDRYTAAGIGGGAGGSGNTVRIYGGWLNAVGGDNAAGIGGGENGNGGDVYIHGGDITASSSYRGAGIGGGRNGNGGNVHFYGGTITAKSSLSGAGIGGGENGHGGNVYINGGTIRAFGGSNGGRNIGGGLGAGTRDGAMKNHSGEPVYLNTLILPDKANRTITAGSTKPDLSYGTKDMQTDENGKVYTYLPKSKGKELVSLTADGVAYYAVYERNGALTQTLYTTPRNWDDVQPFLDLNREGILDISGFVTPENDEVYTFEVGSNKSFTIRGNGTEIQNIAFSFGHSNTIIIDNLNIRSANNHGSGGSIWETEKECTAPLYFKGSDNTLVVKGTNTITSGQKHLEYGWGSVIGIPSIKKLTIKAATGETSAILNLYSNSLMVNVIGDGYRKYGGYAVIDGVTVNRNRESLGTAPDDNHGVDVDTALNTGTQSSSPTYSPQEPNLPIMAVAPVTATAGTNGTASAVIPDNTITDSITKAQADAKAQGKTASKTSAVLNVTMPPSATSLTTILTQTALKSLVSAEVASLEINGGPVPLVLDLAALEEIQKQSGGNITISIAPATGLSNEAKALIGNRPVYSITISSIKDGEIINITDLGNGKTTLSIPYTPSKKEAIGYLFGVFVDANGKPHRIVSSAYDTNANAILLPTGHFSVYGVGYTAPSTKFTDIGTHRSKGSIDYVVGRGLLSGASGTTFAPDSAMTRGMLVTALGKLAGLDLKAYTTSSFTDVKADSAFRPYIEWAFKNGIMQGVGNQQFAPDREITREEIAVIFSNYAKATGYKLPVTRDARPYADASSIESAYITAVMDLQQAGIMMSDTNNHFNPKQNVTRAEVSSMLHRYIKLTIDPATAQGWAQNDAGQWFYYKDGKTLTGTQIIDGMKYFFNIDGTLKAGWVKDDDNSRYYSGNKFLTGWQDINNKQYYFYADGTLAKSTKVDGHEVDENGVRINK